MRRLVVVLMLWCAVFFVSTAQAQPVQFGKNNVRWDDKEYRFYQSYHFDIWHTLDLNDPKQSEHFQKLVNNFEAAYVWMSGEEVFNHSVEKRIPVIVSNTQSEFEFEAARIIGEFVPEGVGALVDGSRHRVVTKEDLMPQLKRAVNVHELAHVFQFDIQSPGVLARVVNSTQESRPLWFYEGGAEFIAGLYDPHTRDDIRRISQRTASSDNHLLPTWEALKEDRIDPYSMGAMAFDFLEEEFGIGVKLQVQGLNQKNIGLGELIYDLSKGELGNPDVNSDKFNQKLRYFWTQKYQLEAIKRPKPYEENNNFKGRSITPWGYPSPMLSPILSPDGNKIAAFTVHAYGVSLVTFDVLKEETYISREERQKSRNSKKIFEKNDHREKIYDLTHHLPPVPWEYLVVQGFETWPFNGFDAAWSKDGKMIAFFARINRDHALVVIDSATGKILNKIKLDLDQSFSPSFDPDGKKIYFSAAQNITRDIYSVDIESGVVKNLTNDIRFDTAPSISPDGTRMAYVGQDGDFQHLFLLDLSIGTKKQLTFGRFNDSSPSWSDDGLELVYTSDEADQIWNLYTLDVNSSISKQWTEFFGGVETPLFARNSKDTIYYVVFRNDDQYKGYIYSNFEIFEAKLKNPIREYKSRDTGPAGQFTFNPTRDLFNFELDQNQVLNPKDPPEKWTCGGGSVSIGASTYWGMFGQSSVKCSNILETKMHLGQFASYGSFRVMDYSYLNQKKRTSWIWGAHQYQIPYYYKFYDIVNRYPSQFLINNTWITESSVDLHTAYPINKFNRVELYSSLKHYSFNILGLKPDDLNENIFVPNAGFTSQDLEIYKFIRDSGGSNLVFGTAYVRDTVLYSGNTWGPFHGNAIRAQVEFAPPLGKEFNGYSSVNLSMRTYRHLGSNSVFAGRAEIIASSRANGDFMLLCGAERVRGCEYGSIAGNQVGYLSGELRFPVPGTVVFYQGMRGFIFADGALSKFAKQDYPAKKIKAYGFGLQYFIPVVGLPAQTVWTKDNGKWKPSFYVTLHW